MRVIFGFVLSLIILLELGCNLSVEANSEIDILQQIQQEIEQKKDIVDQQEKQLNRVEETAQGYLKTIDNYIKITQSQLGDYETQINLANQDLTLIEAELNTAKKAYQPKLKAMVDRLRFLQRQPLSEQGWDILLKSGDFNEFLDRRNRLKLVYQADRKKLAELQQVANHIKQQKMQIEEKKLQIILIAQQLLSQQQQYEGQKQLQQQVIQQLNQDQNTLLAAQLQLEKDSQTIGLLIEQRVAQNPNPMIKGQGKFIYPNSASITSGFGWRKHPILGYKRLHTGIDFGGSYGSSIRAVDDGIVLFSGWYGGYGNAIVLRHDKGISTLYGHCSKLYVKEGDRVTQGQLIAEIGSTGLSTGPHLHFEVREKGQPVDPMKYF